ncbi:uncharacterized protein LOC126389619 isoform X1 [Epinephelus moara]|uniref:uncharacterized protein LOC126389619 isoform X1 n=2 Tax=Epinephelus moara TaxID=300413 RepID=UPI00214EA5B5|nr:uncharacterized protein LOC126389619 isoform X1 [Epinephelus moara]
MSGTQLLKLLVRDRLAAAAEEIFGLVEKTIAECHGEVVRSKREVIQLKQQLEQLTVLKPGVVLVRADAQSVSGKVPASLQQYNIKMERMPVREQKEIQERPQVKEEQVDQCISQNMEVNTFNGAEAKREMNKLKLQMEQQTVLKDGVTPIRPEPPLHRHGLPYDRPLSACPEKDNKLLTMMSGLTHQMTQFAAEVKPQLTAMTTRLLSMEERMAAVEASVNWGPSVEESKRKRRAQHSKIVEIVRRYHNSPANCKHYKPEQGINSPHNEAVTSYLVKGVAACPDLYNVDNGVVLYACRTYYESVCRNIRLSYQPNLAAQAAVMKTSALSRQRRKRLLESRQKVLAPDEMDFWRGITMDMMSDEEDGYSEGVPGWIVRPPSFRSQELTDLCAKLQKRLEACPEYTASHPRRLRIGPPSERMPLNSYDSEAAKRHFKAHLMPQALL